MKAETRKTRRDEIEACAYGLLDEGDGALTMQALAKSAHASMETLYRWYGDRQGLFAALVAGNAATITDTLQAAGQGDPLERLKQVSPILLAMLLGPRAIALNRAAAADPTGTLGAALSKSGRETVAPRLGKLIIEAQETGQLGPGQSREIAEAFFGLLIGDLQIRVVTRAMEPPEAKALAERADRAIEALGKLYPP